MTSFLSRLRSFSQSRRQPGQTSRESRPGHGRHRRARLVLESLEDRLVLSSFTVTDNSDDVTDTGSLRYAIAQVDANSDASNTITIAPTLTGGQTITLTSALPQITRNVSITGPGASVVSVSGNDLYQVFNTAAGNTVTLSGLTVTGGSGYEGGAIENAGTLTVNASTITASSSSFGGGIFNNGGVLTVTGSTITGNSADHYGGGIYNFGTLTVSNSTVTKNSTDVGGGVCISSGLASLSSSTLSGNSATYFGGGVFSYDTLTVSDCTIAGNSAEDGGGIENVNGTVTVTGSTLSGNSATAQGGAISNFGTVIVNGSMISGNSATNGGGIGNGDTATVTNCTIANNSASKFGGGVESYFTATITDSTIAGNSAADYGGGTVFYQAVTIGNTIIAGNTAPTSPDSAGTVTSKGNNLIGKSDGGTGWVASDLTGTSAAPLDPKLGPLADNGGPTQTMALLPGSPAINAGDNALAVDGNGNPLPYDQRGPGYPRIINGTVDIGAYEIEAIPTTTTLATSAPSSTYGQSVTFTATVTAGVNPETAGTVTFLDGTTVLASGVPLNASGQAVFSTSALKVTASPHTLTAGYSGASAVLPSSGTVQETITPAPLTVTAIVPSKVYDGTTAATVASETLVGVLGTDAVSLTGGAATFADKDVGTGKTVTISGLGLTGADAGNYTVNPTATTTASITPAPLTITVANQATVYGQAIPVLTGTVLGVYPGDQVTVNYATPATQFSPVVAGGYPITVSGLTGGDAGDYSYTVEGASVIPGTLTISPDPTATSLASSANPSVFGQAVTFTATVAAVSPGSGTPGGTVQFQIDGVPVGSAVALVNGVATSAAIGTLAVAGHTVTAAYTPADGNYLTSTGNLSQAVNQAATAVTLTASPSQLALNQAVTFVATVGVVAPGTTLVASPAGMVTFYDGTAMLGTGTLSTVDGVTSASFTTSALAAGTHSITAVYAGNGNFLGSTSSTVTQTVLTAAQQAAVAQQLVQSDVTAGVLTPTDASPLLNQLSTAATSLSNGNTKAGVNQLGAAINQVNALVNSGRLSASQGQALIDAIGLAIGAA